MVTVYHYANMRCGIVMYIMKPSYAAAFFAVTVLAVTHGMARNGEMSASAVRTLFDQCQTTITGPDGRPQVIYQRCLPAQGPNNPNTAGPRVTGIIDPDWLRKNMEEQQRRIYRASGPSGCSSASSEYQRQQCLVGMNLENADRAAREAAQRAAMQAAMDAARREYHRPPQQTPEEIAAFRAAQEAAQAAQTAANAQWMQNNPTGSSVTFVPPAVCARSLAQSVCGGTTPNDAVIVGENYRRCTQSMNGNFVDGDAAAQCVAQLVASHRCTAATVTSCF